MARPPILWDNREVKAFLSSWLTFTDLAQALPDAESIFTGATLLKPQGDTATRPLARWRLFLLLTYLDTISTEEVTLKLPPGYSRQSAERYTGTLRVISKGLQEQLRCPEWRAVAHEARLERQAEEEMDSYHPQL